MPILSPAEIEFIAAILMTLLCGFLIGTERELRGKPAGISTNSLVIGSAMLFTFISQQADPNSPARIAAQIVSGVGFLGAGIILKSDSTKRVTFLTTAASIWFSAAIGMAIGFGFYLVALIATLFTILIPRVPHVAHILEKDHTHEDDDE
jgi:putative Mg2+ transporter-C (MgtC) family protein